MTQGLGAGPLARLPAAVRRPAFDPPRRGMSFLLLFGFDLYLRTVTAFTMRPSGVSRRKK